MDCTTESRIQDQLQAAEAPMALIVLLALMVAIDLLTFLFGADSRDYRQPEYPLSGFGDAAR
jgi:hypothetical protein